MVLWDLAWKADTRLLAGSLGVTIRITEVLKTYLKYDSSRFETSIFYI